jgi:hypothetical protein
MEFFETIHNTEELVEHYIGKCEEKYNANKGLKYANSEDAYFKAKDYFQKTINFESFSTDNIDQMKITLRKYLYNWGTMGRVLGQEKKYPDWQNDTINVIKKFHYELKLFSNKHLVDEPIDDHRDNIKSIYFAFQGDEVKPLLGRIAATKVMHIICPDFFPIWDNSIGDGFRAELNKNGNIKPFSPEDYLRFMYEIQKLLKRVDTVLNKFEYQSQTTKVKLLDECLLWAVRRPFYMFSIGTF